jgi:hypothetical protein
MLPAADEKNVVQKMKKMMMENSFNCNCVSNP